MVKFSTADGSFETFRSTRANSSPSYLYGIPHSPVFLLMMRVFYAWAGVISLDSFAATQVTGSGGSGTGTAILGTGGDRKREQHCGNENGNFAH